MTAPAMTKLAMPKTIQQILREYCSQEARWTMEARKSTNNKKVENWNVTGIL